MNFLWVANFNLKFGVLHQIHCFLFQFDSSLLFIMQILINVWYVCVNKQWTVNIHLIFYRLLQQTILTSCSQFKATIDWLSLCQWLFKRKYHLLFSCTYFVLSQNPYTKQLFLDSVHSPYIEQKQQAVSHSFQHLFKKNGSIISVVGKSTVEIMELFWVYTKSPIWPIMKSDQTHIRKGSYGTTKSYHKFSQN